MVSEYPKENKKKNKLPIDEHPFFKIFKVFYLD